MSSIFLIKKLIIISNIEIKQYYRTDKYCKYFYFYPLSHCVFSVTFIRIVIYQYSEGGYLMSAEATAEFSIHEAQDKLTQILEQYRHMPGSTIPILQAMQETFGYLPEEAVYWIADQLDVPRSNFFGVATFYSQFYLNPRGKHVITVCCGTACHVKGAEKIMNQVRRDLNLQEGQETTDDLMFTIEKANCVGACSIAPVVLLDKTVHGKAKPDAFSKQIKSLTREGS